MAYTTRQRYDYKYYYPSDTVLAWSPDEYSTTSDTYSLKNELELVNTIHPDSRFRFLFDLNSPAGSQAIGKIYKNGIAIGTEQTRIGAYETKTEDIDIGNWRQGDKVQLYLKSNAGGNLANCKNLKISGTPSLWIINY